MPRKTRSTASGGDNEPPPKRVKTSASLTTRGRGKLRMLPEMPLDILFEIFSFLDPADVLCLARTTKDLRGVLMSRSAISIWRSAFLNDPDLPAVPDGMNEPQYANLAFSQHCHYCFVSGEHNILWAFRVRVCQKCLPERFAEIHLVLKKLTGSIMNTHYTFVLRNARAYVPPRYLPTFVYSIDEAQEINAQLLKLKKAGADKLEAYVAERKKAVGEINAHAEKAVMSVPLRLARMQRMLQEARDRRKDQICKRLIDLGYEEEVKKLNEANALAEHDLIKSEKELTERAWTIMKPQLLELMQDTREKLQRRQRKSLLKKRQRLLLSALKEYNVERPIDEVNPRAADVCAMPHLKAMIEDPSLDAHVTEDSFKDIVEGFPRHFEQWREAKTLDLMALLPTPNDREALLRATTYFGCSECSEPLSYPRVLAHECLTRLRHGYRNREDELALLFMNLDSEPWNYGGNRVSYYPAAECSATSVVRSCGLDVDLTTAQDMDDVNPWLECLRCSHKVKGRAVFRWRKAILHDMYHVSAAESASWRLLDGDDSDAAETLQKKMRQTDYSASPDYECVRCRERHSFLQMQGHLRVSHAITTPQNDEDDPDYVLQVDASMDQPPFLMMLPHAAPEVIVVPDDDEEYELEYFGTSNTIMIDD